MTTEDSSRLNQAATLAQVFALLIGGLWASYMFLYKEFIKPKMSPVMLDTTVQLKVIGENDTHLAIEATFEATNPGLKKTSLLTSAFVAWGSRLNVNSNDKEFTESFSEFAKNSNDGIIFKHTTIAENTPISAGQTFSNWDFKPKEKASRKLIFYVPKDTYDIIEVKAYFPAVEAPEKYLVSWKMANDGSLKPTFSKKEKKTYETMDKYSEEITIFATTYSLSLWANPKQEKK